MILSHSRNMFDICSSTLTCLGLQKGSRHLEHHGGWWCGRRRAMQDSQHHLDGTACIDTGADAKSNVHGDTTAVYQQR